MFEMLRSQSKSATGAILYVTVGTLLMIWAGLSYYYFLMNNPEAPAWANFLCIGTILSGLAVASIGLMFGLIGRGAKGADTTVGVAPIGPMVAPGVMPGAVGGQVLPAGPMVANPNAVPMTAAPMTNAGYGNPNH